MSEPDTRDIEGGTAEEDLAGRGARLGAYLIDMIIVGAVGGVIAYALGWFEGLMRQDPTAVVSVLLLTIIVFGVINGRWLVTRGQTVGKRLVGVRIVDTRTQEIVPLVKSYGLRFIVVQAITQVPFAGPILALVDPLFIFGERRRCLHDYLAGTIVVRADDATTEVA